jgi:septum formation protein
VNPLLSAAAQRGLVLASKSPRRIDILRGLNVEVDVDPARDHVEDGVSSDDPFALPLEAARLKAADVAARRPDDLVIGADTVVILDDHLLEKPVNDEQARKFLKMLSGKTHTVVTGVALRRMNDGTDVARAERTQVQFRPLTDEQIERYVASGEGRDKAGSYAVQGLGAGLVSSVQGCFYNVVGLPVVLLFNMLEEVSGEA